MSDAAPSRCENFHIRAIIPGNTIVAPGEITRLIEDWQRGDKSAENALFDAMYHRLHQLALHCLRTERADQSMGATALIHEAYLRFNRSENLAIADRAHFLALSARVMRRILVDRARARQTAKRGADGRPVELDDALVRTDSDADQILSIDRALESLGQRSKRLATLVELRCFAGYTLEECAAALGVAERTAKRDWKVAMVRLQQAIDGVPSIT